jgi:hypothetical protein
VTVEKRRGRGDGGWASAQLVIFMPLAFLAVGMILLAALRGGRQAEVTTAARDAARAASLQPSFAVGSSEAERTARARLAGDRCAALRVTVADPRSFRAGGQVTVTVECDVDLRAIPVPGVPAMVTVSATEVEVIDRWRGGLG